MVLAARGGGICAAASTLGVAVLVPRFEKAGRPLQRAQEGSILLQDAQLSILATRPLTVVAPIESVESGLRILNAPDEEEEGRIRDPSELRNWTSHSTDSSVLV